MPRCARILNELEFYHVMIRGINQEWIFSTDEDKNMLVDLIDIKRDKLNVKVYGYCVMDNHLHLLLWAEAGHFGRYMHKINFNYGMYYSRKYNRKGHVFENRYRHENIEDERHLLATLRYIHRNPVKAGLVEVVQDYRWSSIHDYVQPLRPYIILTQECRQEIIENYFGNLEHFEEFHQQFDHELYLEIQEQRDEEVKYWVERKMQEVMAQHKLSSIEDISFCPPAKEWLMEELKYAGKLSSIEIAEQLQISKRTVERFFQENRQKRSKA